jgi:AraC family transcriptional regulator
MPRAATTLASGRFFGANFRTAQSASFDVSEGDATCPGSHVPRHTHASSHFVLVVRGSYLSDARNSRGHCAPGALIFNPTGTTHRDRFAAPGGRFLCITPSAELAQRADAAVPVTLALEDPHVLRFALAARRSLGAGHLEELEEAGLELIGAVAAPLRDDTVSRDVPAWLLRSRERLREECASDLAIGALAADCGVHPVHFARAFRRHFHMAPSAYLRRCRIDRARHLLLAARLPLAAIALEVGFSEQSHFTHAFAREIGMPPSAYRRQARR